LVLPVGGLIQVGSQIAADRYSYQPGWALTLMLCTAFFALLGSASIGALRRRGVPLAAVPTVLVLAAILCGRTIPQQAIWHDTNSLWNHQLAMYPRTAIAHFGLAMEFESRRGPKDDTAAERHYRDAIAIFPDYMDARQKLALLLRRNGRTTEAREVFEK